MTDVRLAVIGLGNIGFVHASSVYNGKISGMKLMAVCDIDPLRREIAQKELPGVHICQDYEALLRREDIDAVVIAVPHPMHSAVAMEAFARGKHVLVEKPVDIAVSKARQLNEAARASGKLFAIMFNQRTGNLFRKARQILQSGGLGSLKRSVWIITNWYRTQHYYDSGSWRATWQGEGGGVLMNQAPHQLDLWQWICGMPESVTAFCNEAKYHRIEVEDEATLVVRFPGGAEGVFITSTGEYPGTNRLEISGTKGKLVLENGALKWWKLDMDEREVCEKSESSFEKIPYTYEEFLEEKGPSGHMQVLQNFADAILHGTALIAPGYEGICELSIQNAAYLSAWKDKWVNIPCDRKEFEKELDAHRKASEKINVTASSKSEENCSGRWKTKW